jgi:hypothetical protein
MVLTTSNRQKNLHPILHRNRQTPGRTRVISEYLWNWFQRIQTLSIKSEQNIPLSSLSKGMK